MIELIEKDTSTGETTDTLTLPYDLRQKSRQRVELDSGCEAAVLLPHGTRLCEGDQLRTSEGGVVRICAAAESVSTVRTHDPVMLTRACYHLGNRHVSLQVGEGWLRYQPDHVLDDMVRGLGLDVVREQACYEPERGAYHDHGPGDSSATHEHGHDHSHAHENANEPVAPKKPYEDTTRAGNDP